MGEVIFIGNAYYAEFTPAVSVLTEYIMQTDAVIMQLPEINRKKQLAEVTADFFLLFQSYPVQFSVNDIVSIKKNNPFSPVLLIAGCCCEGAARTAGILPGVFRFYIFQVNERLSAEVAAFLTGKDSLFSLPQPIADEEIILYQAGKPAGGKCNKAKLAGYAAEPLTDMKCCIVSRFGPLGNDSAMNGLLADIYRGQGFAILSDLNELPAGFNGKIIADADDSLFSQILDSCQRIRRSFADSDITVYINSPRINEKNALCNAGVNLVLPKL